MRNNASELAQVVAQWVPALPQSTAIDLYRLLGHDLAAPTSGAIRHERLGLLVQLVSDLTGQAPTCEDYEWARARRREAGEDWPTSTSLIRAYGGHWLRAVRSAMRHATGGTSERVPHSLHHARFRKAYRPGEVIDAIKACRSYLADWPTPWEYEQWAVIRRRLARAAGLPEPRLPALPPIRKLFGSWDQALAAARTGVEE